MERDLYNNSIRKQKNNTWKCNCQTRNGKLREFRYINNYIIEKKNYPFWFNDNDSDTDVIGYFALHLSRVFECAIKILGFSPIFLMYKAASRNFTLYSLLVLVISEKEC